jgi:hypothetical protein
LADRFRLPRQTTAFLNSDDAAAETAATEAAATGTTDAASTDVSDVGHSTTTITATTSATSDAINNRHRHINDDHNHAANNSVITINTNNVDNMTIVTATIMNMKIMNKATKTTQFDIRSVRLVKADNCRPPSLPPSDDDCS